MGFWNNGLYDNDLAVDIKEEYMELLTNYSVSEAHSLINDSYIDIKGTDEEALFWYVLFDLQKRNGHLNKETKEKVMYYLESDNPFPFLPNELDLKQKWYNIIKQLNSSTTNSITDNKTTNLKEFVVSNPWNIGDIYVYQFHSEIAKKSGIFNKYIPIQKIENDMYTNVPCSRIRIFNSVYDYIPSASEILSKKVLPLDLPERFMPSGYNRDFPLFLNAVAIVHKSEDYPERYLTYVDNNKSHVADFFPDVYASSFFWRDIEAVICDYYKSWENYDYILVDGAIKVYRNK